MTERRTIRRAAEEAIAPPHPGMSARFVEPDELQSDALPPGFAGRPARTYDVDPDDRFANMYSPQALSRPTSTQLMFRMRPTPWYRKTGTKIGLVVAGLVAAVASIVVLLWPTSLPAPQETRTTAPVPTPSAAPAPSASPTLSASLAPAAPPPVLLPPPLPPPPPPPPPSASAPAQQAPVYSPPRYQAPATKKPEIGVTRAPISVAPPTKPPSQRDSSAPGDAPVRRGCFGFC